MRDSFGRSLYQALDIVSYAYANRHAVADCPQGQFFDPAPPFTGIVASIISIDVLDEALSLSVPTKCRAARRVSASKNPCRCRAR